MAIGARIIRKMSPNRLSETLIRLIDRSLDFQVGHAAATPIEDPHSTGWRILPELVVAVPVAGARGGLQVEGGPELLIPEGTAWAVRGGLPHCARLRSPRGVSLWAHVTFRILGAIDPLALVEAPIVRSAGARIGEICCELAILQRTPTDLHALARGKALGFELLALLLIDARPLPQALERLRILERIAPALALTEERLGQGGPAIPTLAKAAGVSPSHLHALFHEALGCSPLQHVLTCRIRRAQHLLLASDLPVAVVAQRSGFGDAFHFSRSFRRACGLSPTAYRAKGFGSAP